LAAADITADMTVYAVWGFDTTGNGIPDICEWVYVPGQGSGFGNATIVGPGGNQSEQRPQEQPSEQPPEQPPEQERPQDRDRPIESGEQPTQGGETTQDMNSNLWIIVILFLLASVIFILFFLWRDEEEEEIET